LPPGRIDHSGGLAPQRFFTARLAIHRLQRREYLGEKLLAGDDLEKFSFANRAAVKGVAGDGG